MYSETIKDYYKKTVHKSTRLKEGRHKTFLKVFREREFINMENTHTLWPKLIPIEGVVKS